MMEGRLKDAGFALAFDSIRCKFKPTEQTLQLCEESGTDLAQEVRRRQKLKERSSECEGRVWGVACGRACVLTCMWMLAHECEHAQASFDPPGLTVAVKQDRAVEALLPVGARFVMNVLAEGRDKVRMHAWREAGAW